MSTNKTVKTTTSVTDFINTVEQPQKRADAFRILKLMQSITGHPPALWGGSIIGFGDVHYKYASGREGDWFEVGFSPRKANLTLYIMSGFSRYAELLKRLGKHKTGKACLYINKLSDIDEDILKKIIQESVRYIKTTPEVQEGS